MDTYTSAMMPLSIEIIIVSMVLTCAITFFGKKPSDFIWQRPTTMGDAIWNLNEI